MNFLAHTFLSCRDEKMLIGNFLGDFVKNKDLDQYDEAIQEGIFLHRKIDTYTDNHPIVKQGSKRLHEIHGKYAPVIIDVYYDHFLAINWEKYSNESLNDFALRVYAIFQKDLDLFPEKMKRRIVAMVNDNWLISYVKLSGLQTAFNRLQSRLSQPQFLDGVMQSLERDYILLDQEFQQFFPDVMLYVDTECNC